MAGSIATAFEGPVAESPVSVRYAWKAAVNHDQSRVAVSYGHWSETGRIIIFDLKTGEELHRIPNPSGVRALVATPDGKQFVTGDFGGNFSVWDFSTAAQVRRWRQPRGSVESLCFTPDGKRLVSSSNAPFIVVWDFETNQPLGGSTAHTKNIYGLAVSPDGKRIASSDSGGDVIISDLESGAELHRMRHSEPADSEVMVNAVAWSVDGSQLWSAGIRGHLRQWDTQTGEMTGDVQTDVRGLYSVCLSPDGRSLLAGTGNGALIRFDRETLEQQAKLGTSTPPRDSPFGEVPFFAKPKADDAVASDEGHTTLILGLRTFGANYAITASWDSLAKLWDLRSGRCLRTFAPKASSDASVVGLVDPSTFARETTNSEVTKPKAENHVLVVGADGTVRQVDGRTLQEASRDKLPIESTLLESIRWFSSYGRTFAMGDDSGNWLRGLWPMDGTSFSAVALEPVKLDPAESETADKTKTSSTSQSASTLACRLVPVSDSAKTEANDDVDLILAKSDGTLCRYSLRTGKQRKCVTMIPPTLPADQSVAWTSATIRSDGKQLVFMNASQTLVKSIDWSGDSAAASGPPGSQTIPVFNNPNRSPFTHYATDNLVVVSVSQDASVFWPLQNEDGPDQPSEVRRIRLMQTGHVTATLPLAGGQSLIVANASGGIKRFQRPLPKIPPVTARKVADSHIFFVTHRRDGKEVWAMEQKRKLHRIHPTSLEVLKPAEEIVDQQINSGIETKDQSHLIFGTYWEDAECVRTDSWTTEPVFAPRALKSAAVTFLAISPDGSRLAFCGDKGSIEVIDRVTRKSIWSASLDALALNAIGWSPDGKRIAVGSGRWQEWQLPGRGYLLDAETGDVQHTWNHHRHKLNVASFSPDGKYVFTGGNQNIVFRHPVDDPATIDGQIQLPISVDRLVWLDQRHAVLCLHGGGVQVWDMINDQQVAVFTGHDEATAKAADPKAKLPMIRTASVSPDKKHIVTGDFNGWVYVWPITWELEAQTESR